MGRVEPARLWLSTDLSTHVDNVWKISSRLSPGYPQLWITMWITLEPATPQVIHRLIHNCGQPVDKLSTMGPRACRPAPRCAELAITKGACGNPVLPASRLRKEIAGTPACRVSPRSGNYAITKGVSENRDFVKCVSYLSGAGFWACDTGWGRVELRYQRGREKESVK